MVDRRAGVNLYQKLRKFEISLRNFRENAWNFWVSKVKHVWPLKIQVSEFCSCEFFNCWSSDISSFLYRKFLCLILFGGNLLPISPYGRTQLYWSELCPPKEIIDSNVSLFFFAKTVILTIGWIIFNKTSACFNHLSCFSSLDTNKLSETELRLCYAIKMHIIVYGCLRNEKLLLLILFLAKFSIILLWNWSFSVVMSQHNMRHAMLSRQKHGIERR